MNSLELTGLVYLSTLLSSVVLSDPLQVGQNTITDFKHRYNTTKEVDLVFVLDRSGSVPRHGWISMINFVKDLLEHFTVDKDNTRVAIITFSTQAVVDLNDLEPGPLTDLESKCSLNWRIQYQIERKIPYGYTATNDGLEKAYDVLLDSRPNAKKAVLILTDGRSNIGEPPVKMAFEILSLKWNQSWNESLLGPQVEIYGFGIENASLPELDSMASSLPNHTFLIPDFEKFEQFARRLHGDKQEDQWILAQGGKCESCGTKHAHCMCGSKIGQYICACDPGYERDSNLCVACRRGYYKDTRSPEPCRKCPPHSTTSSFGAKSREQCELLPGYQVCPDLADITHGGKFYVSGSGLSEVADTGRACENVTDGNSCHYRCNEGYRLSGSPVMLCNRTGSWIGTVPQCSIVDCGDITEAKNVPFMDEVVVDYVDNRTTYKAVAQASCKAGHVAIGTTTWMCDKNGRWTKPPNFMCTEVFCKPPIQPKYAKVTPKRCQYGRTPLGQSCSFACKKGFKLSGVYRRECTFDFIQGPVWAPSNSTVCEDVEAPVVNCPDDIRVDVAHPGDNGTVVYFNKVLPTITDNSGAELDYDIHGIPDNLYFNIGVHPMKYTAKDEAGNKANCTQYIYVKAKTATIVSCPSSITKNAVGISTEVTWDDPVFVTGDNTTLETKCDTSSGSGFPVGQKHVACTAVDNNYDDTVCSFTVDVKGPSTCHTPSTDEVSGPANGAFMCTKTTAIPNSCRIHCKKGYVLKMRNSEHHMFRCGWDGQWSPSLGKVLPACQRSLFIKRGQLEKGIHVEFEGKCEERVEAIKAGFISTMDTLLNGDQGICPVNDGFSCAVTNVELQCGHRSRRSVGSAQHHLLTRGGRSRRQVPGNPGNGSLSHAVIQYNVRVTTNMSDDEISEVHEENRRHPLVDALDDLYQEMDTKVTAGLTFEANNESISVTQLQVDDVNFEECDPGAIPSDDVQFPMCYACPQGTYKDLGECKVCPKDTYQDMEGQLECMPCPNGTFTVHEGSQNNTDCRAPCPENTHSTYGLTPCEQCPVGFHQPEEGHTECLPCNATDSVYCNRTLNNCTDDGSANENCIQTCETWNCYNNGTCLDTSGVAACRCITGYTGKHCEEDMDECLAMPCANHSLCLDMVGDYICLCPTGYDGKNCDNAVNYCQDLPCGNGTCIDEVDRFRCKCDTGFTGERCDLRIDFCAEVVCENGGQCENSYNSSVCDCNDGYYGSRCELMEDVCRSSPCVNGGSCYNKGTAAKCKCPLGFTGDKCQTETSDIFDLIFPFASTDQYVMMDIIHDLSDLTTCFWVRTSDKNNYGTIFSYAAESNLLLPTAGNDFTLYNYGGLKLFVNEEVVSTNVSITDGVWHHICVTWSSGAGEWQLLVDSTRRARGHGLAKGTIINGGGSFILGQDQDYVGGGFNARESFIGEMSSLVMNSRVMSTEDIEKLSQSCTSRQGDVLSWTETLGGMTDAVKRRRRSRCLDKNECVYSDACGYGDYCVDHIGSYECLPCDNARVCKEEPIGGETDIESICSHDGKCLYGKLDTENQCVWKLSGPSHAEEGDSLKCEICPQKYPEGSIPREPGCYCSLYPCQNGGSCTYNGFYEECKCLLGFTGVYCETDVYSDKGCSNMTCLNNGSCVETNGRSVCECTEHWRGDHCQVRYSPSCDNYPCVNNGTCVPGNDTNPLHCVCDPSMAALGENCEVLSPCESSPCGEYGACVNNGDGTFLCQCQFGYEGQHCEIYHKPETTTEKADMKETTPIPVVDICANVACHNGGTCQEGESGFSCKCVMDYKGLYCDVKRIIDVRKYDVGVTLKKKFSQSLKYNRVFKEEFQKQIHLIYLEATKDSRLQVNITGISEGSVYVDFVLIHTTYQDSTSKGPLAMREILENELLKGKLGIFDASFERFVFNEDIKGEGVAKTVLFAIIGILLFAIIVVGTIFLVVLICRRRRTGKNMRYNNAPKIVQNNIGNPAYMPEFEPTMPTTKECHDENIYAEPGEYLEPYCVRSSKEDLGADLGQRFPSKRGREINKEWEKSLMRQSIPLPPKPDNISNRGSCGSDDYVPPSRGSPPPRYSQVEADCDSPCYADRTLTARSCKKSPTIEPLSEEDEKRGLVRAGSEDSNNGAAGVNPGFVSDDYLNPRELPKQCDYENTIDRNPPAEAPLYLAILPDTPPAGATANKDKKQKPGEPATDGEMREKRPQSLPIYAIENNGLCSRL